MGDHGYKRAGDRLQVVGAGGGGAGMCDGETQRLKTPGEETDSTRARRE
jgi:hypothetical protein